MILKTGKDKFKVFMFVVPALVVYLVFLVVPLLSALFFSAADWNGIAGSPLKLVGLKNYISVFSDPGFILSLKNMGRMVFFSVLFHTPIALLLAVAINTKCKGYRFYKAVYFVPTVFPLISVGLLWYFVFMPNGSLNTLLGSIGLKNMVTPWLVNPSTAMNTIIFVNIWAGIGYFMVILIAGLTTISDDIIEAAQIDGVTSVKKFFLITVPMLKPIIAMCIVMDIIGTVKVFDLIFVMTEGGPDGLTNLPTTLMYFEAFRYDHYGIGSAIGIIIFGIALILTAGSEYLTYRTEE